jgi:hypothetical protein
MADIAELGFVADSSQLKAANDQLEKLPGNAAKAEKGVDKLNDEMTRGERATMRFYQSLERLSYKIGQSIGTELRRAAVGFAAVFAVGAVVQRLTQTADALDQVSKAARATDAAVGDVQALAVAGELAGVGIDQMLMAVRRNNKALAAAIATGKGTEGVYKAIGMSATELANMPVDKRFAAIADRINELNLSASDTTYVLSQLGDRTGALVGLLGEGGDQIRKAAGDVDRFHLAITKLQGENIEDMNDNFTRLGYAVQGAFNQFIASIAPAASALFITIANTVALVVGNMDKIAPVAQIAGAAMLTAFGPTILSALMSLVVAVGTGLVGAIRLVGLAIASNPLGALAVAIVTIITAVWTFRDAIKNAIGVDVVQIAKDAGNFVIRSFLEAFERIKTIWNNFPAVMGSAIFGAVNAMISGLNFLIAKAVEGINTLINLIPEQIRMGIGPLSTTTGSIGSVANPFESQMQAATTIQDTNVAIIRQTDYIGALTQAWDNLTTATDTTTISTDAAAGAVDSLGSSLADVASGASKNAADAIEKVKDKVAELKNMLMDTVGTAFKSFFMDIMHGKNALDALNNSLGNLADKLMDMVLNQALMSIFGSIIGGGFGGLGAGLVSGIGYSGPSLIGGPTLGSANGNVFSRSGIVSTPTTFKFANGGIGEMGEKGPEAVIPLERGRNGKLGLTAPDGGTGSSVIVIQPIIHNNASNDVSVSTQQGDDGTLEITIDKVMASKIGNPGSRTAKSLQATYGLKRTGKGR